MGAGVTDPSGLPDGCDTWLDAAVQTLCGFHPSLHQSAEWGWRARSELESSRALLNDAIGLFVEWHLVHCEDHCTCDVNEGAPAKCLQCRSKALYERLTA